MGEWVDDDQLVASHEHLLVLRVQFDRRNGIGSVLNNTRETLCRTDLNTHRLADQSVATLLHGRRHGRRACSRTTLSHGWVHAAKISTGSVRSSTLGGDRDDVGTPCNPDTGVFLTLAVASECKVAVQMHDVANLLLATEFFDLVVELDFVAIAVGSNGILTALNLGGDGSNSSSYSMYRIWLASLSLHCGWKIECENLRIPSTRNWALVGKRITFVV